MRSLKTVDRYTRSAMQDEKDQSILSCWQEVQFYCLSTKQYQLSNTRDDSSMTSACCLSIIWPSVYDNFRQFAPINTSTSQSKNSLTQMVVRPTSPYPRTLKIMFFQNSLNFSQPHSLSDAAANRWRMLRHSDNYFFNLA